MEHMGGPMDKNDIKRHLGNLADERNGAWLYKALADAEEDARIAEIYRRFAATENKHADVWARQLADAGVVVPEFRPSARSRILAWLARRFGVGLVLPSVRGMEQTAASSYSKQADAAGFVAEETSHSRLLQQMTSGMAGGLGGSAVAQVEGRHGTGGGNALRAAVLGANDGLVSNLSLIMGVAGANLASGSALVAGLAGLLAGACSMAMGEWLSVQSSRELYQRQVEIESAEIASNPQEEAEELSLIYQSRGLPVEQSDAMALRILNDQANAIQTLAREELGIDPEELGGSPWVAAITSFILFAVGAVIPVIPLMFAEGRTAIMISAAGGTLGLFAIGAAITLVTGRPAWKSGLRMVIIGLVAASITFVIGRLIGMGISA
jgi:vacuolar iron transporter family protein